MISLRVWGWVLVFAFAGASVGQADPYNRRPPAPPPSGPPGPPPVYRPPPGAPVPRVPPGVPNAVRQRNQIDALEAQREGADASEGDPQVPLGEAMDAQTVMENWEEVQRTELGNEIMEEFLDRAGSDKPPEDVLREAIDSVLDRRGVSQERRDRAADAVSGDLWPGGGEAAGGEDHPHGPDGAPLATDTPEKPPGPVIRVDRDQVERIMAGEMRDGASQTEVQQQLDDLNRALGGSGSVPIPELERVVAPDGQVLILNTDDATRYRDAMHEAQRAEADRDRARAAIDHLNAEADRWVFWEQNIELRAAAGIAGLMETVGQGDAERAAIQDRITALEQEPRPQVIWHHNDEGDWVYAGTGKTEYGGQVYDDWDSAMEDYDNRRGRIGELRDEMDRVPSDVERIQRQTRTRTGDAQYNPTDPDGGLIRQARDGLGHVAGTHTPDMRRDTDVMRSTEGPGESGMFNRPAERLGQIEETRDLYRGDYARATERVRDAESQMQRIAGMSR